MTSRIDHYTCYQTLGCGNQAKVKFAKDNQGNEFALKIYDLTNIEEN